MEAYRWPMVPILAALTMGFLGAAHAEDFTFTVPLRLNNLHSMVGAVRVFCQALNASETMIGAGNTIVPVDPTGNVSQDVVVKFNAQATQVASDATQYKCFFDLGAKGSQEWFAPRNSGPATVIPKPGATFVPAVGGPIPKQAGIAASPTLIGPAKASPAVPIAPK